MINNCWQSGKGRINDDYFTTNIRCPSDCIWFTRFWWMNSTVSTAKQMSK